MRKLLARPLATLSLGLAGSALLAGACASPDAPSSADTSARRAAPEHVAPGTSYDPATALWGDPSVAEAAGLRAFLADDPGRTAPDDLTRAVSMTTGGLPPSGHEVRALRLRDGKLLAGRLVSDDGKVVEFAFETPDGVRGTTRVAYADIHPESVAELMLARADEGDAASLMDIAEYAAGERLFEVARVHYLAAADADPSVAGIAAQRLRDLSDQVSEAELARGREASEAGNDAAARLILRRVQREFADTPAAEHAAAQIAAIDARAAERKLDAAREKQLEPIRSLVADAADLTDQGLRVAHRPSSAIRPYMAARAKATSARRRIPAARRSAERSGDGELLAAVDDLEARIDEQEIDNETQLATAYLDSGDFTRARQAANAVLVIDGQNREALALLGQIRAAEEERRAATYDAWWYRYRRSYGVYPYPHHWYPQRGAGWGTIRRGGTYTRPPIGVFQR